MTAYYNENDHKLCDWLRELIKQGHIAPGRVDGRSIVDVSPDELRGYTQCHFFAGIGGWSKALRLAEWPDDRPVWTGSCPCQPFSTAGKRKGTADERHLWPAWFWLIDQCRPPVIFGEQVEAAISHGWLDLVSDDLEGIGYAVGAVAFPACSVGAPHKRQRVYFVAESECCRRQLQQTDTGIYGTVDEKGKQESNAGSGFDPSRLAESQHPERWAVSVSGEDGRHREDGRREETHGQPGACGEVHLLADTRCAEDNQQGYERPAEQSSYGQDNGVSDGNGSGVLPVADTENTNRRPGECGTKAGIGEDGQRRRGFAEPSPTNGFWRDAVWLPCRDGKYRAVEPGLTPLAHGVPARVVRLRGYGNAIVVPQAAAFIEAYMSLFGEGKGSGE